MKILLIITIKSVTSKKSYLSEELIRKTIENFEGRNFDKVKRLRKSQYAAGYDNDGVYERKRNSS